MSTKRAAGHKLLEQAVGLDLEVTATDIQPTTDHKDSVVRIELQYADPEDVEYSALGVIFALGVLSFAGAVPRGASEIDFKDHDEFGVVDLVELLRFEHGELHMYADYVRGRCMKTDVTVRKDGTVTIETVNRGQEALAWVRRLRGKKPVPLSEMN